MKRSSPYLATVILLAAVSAACGGDAGAGADADGGLQLRFPDLSAEEDATVDALSPAPDAAGLPDLLLPVCPCFVKVAWCGSGVAKEAVKRGCRVPLLPAHSGAILHCPGGTWSVKQSCAKGCVEAPAGTADFCRIAATYLLPFDCGTNRRCSNGNHTSTHTGKDAYAYDFALPVGTSLRAMRGGKVLRTRLVAKPGSPCYSGGGSSCANYANTVEILHAGGTVGLYMHLSSIAVKAGQSVKQGQLIGKSGNSGWSTGPHLHCQVQKSCGSWWCQSIPFSFGEVSKLSTGAYVTSKNCP